MPMIRLRDANGERQVKRDQLFAAMTAGRTNIQGDVQPEDGGPWVSAGVWYLNNSQIAQASDSDGKRYIARHVVEELDLPSVLAFLGADEMLAADLAIPGTVIGHDHIEIPAWGDSAWGREHVVRHIEYPGWAPDPTGEIADFIAVPDWGAPYSLPVMQSIEVPPWRDPAKASYRMPVEPPVVWRRMAVEQPMSAPPKRPAEPVAARPKRPARTRRHPARPPAARQQDAKAKPKRAPERQSKAKKRRSHAPAAQPVAELISSSRGLGLFGCIGQLIGILALVFAVAVATDLGLQGVIGKLRELNLVAPALNAAPTARKELPALLVEGPQKSWLQVVMRADMGDMQQVRAMARVMSRVAAAAARGLPDGQAPRLVFLPAIGARPGATELAGAIAALAQQQAFWPWFRGALRRGEAVDVADIAAALDELGVDAPMWQAQRAQSEAALRVRTWSTMAAALGMADGMAAINGRVLGAEATATDDQVESALVNAMADVATAMAENADDRPGAYRSLLNDLPDRTAERWLRWIVRAERLPTRPLAPSPAEAKEPDLPDRVDIAPPKGAASMGSPKALVTVLVFIDFHCPFSKRHAANYGRLVKDFGADVRLVVAHFPIAALHADAEAAASLAVAAQAQGLFWPTHDLLFERAELPWSDRATVKALVELAGGVGIKVRATQLQQRRRRAGTRAIVTHRKLGEAHGVNGTPYTFINGRPFRGAVPYARLRAVVQAELDAALADPPSADGPEPEEGP